MQKRSKRGYHGESILSYYTKKMPDGVKDQLDGDPNSFTTPHLTPANETPLPKPQAKCHAESQSSKAAKDHHPSVKFGSRTTNAKCPGYKWVPDTPFTVDAFSYGEIPGCQAYFLSHFHRDHYGGLTRDFNGPIYCSQVTRGLLIQNFQSGLNVTALELNYPMLVCGIQVVAMDANHCPGSVMLLFHVVARKYFVLHTGDFRFSLDMLMPPSPLAQFLPPKSDPCTTAMRPKLHSIYLDTTYCAPQYDFLPQHEVIAGAVQVTRKWLAKDPTSVVVCGMYSIGKERFVYGLASELDLTVWLPRTQDRLVRVAAQHGCTVSQALLERTTTNFNKARLHVVPLSQINMSQLSQYAKQLVGPTSLQTPFNVAKPMPPRTIIAWRPTGWSHAPKTSGKCISNKIHATSCDTANGILLEKSSGNIHIYGAAYSEHSSFPELREFVTALQPNRVQPTVFGGAARSCQELIKLWLKSSSNHDDR